MPVGFVALFVAIFGGGPAGDPAAGTSMLATFGTFGVLSVMLMNPRVGVADDRERGWLRAKRVSAAPVWTVVAGKVAPYLPPYHLAQLALAQISGGPALGHALVLLATAPAAAGLAAVSYRSSRP